FGCRTGFRRNGSLHARHPQRQLHDRRSNSLCALARWLLLPRTGESSSQVPDAIEFADRSGNLEQSAGGLGRKLPATVLAGSLSGMGLLYAGPGFSFHLPLERTEPSPPL